MIIDHHIQTTILKKLTKANQAVPYTELKQADIENSLFSYHLNKLISRKMVKKDGTGYLLTAEGAEWLNDTGFDIVPIQNVRANIKLIVQNDSGEYLVTQRTGQYKAVINEFMLPGHYYLNDTDLSEQVENTIAAYIPKESLVKTADFGFAQIKLNYPGKTLYNLFHITYCQTKKFELNNPYHALELEWCTLDELDAIDHPSAEVLRQAIAYTKQDTNQHQTPLFIG